MLHALPDELLTCVVESIAAPRDLARLACVSRATKAASDRVKRSRRLTRGAVISAVAAFLHAFGTARVTRTSWSPGVVITLGDWTYLCDAGRALSTHPVHVGMHMPWTRSMLIKRDGYNWFRPSSSPSLQMFTEYMMIRFGEGDAALGVVIEILSGRLPCDFVGDLARVLGAGDSFEYLGACDVSVCLDSDYGRTNCFFKAVH